MDLESGHTKLIADDPRTDVGGVLVHPTEKNIQAVSFTYGRTEWKVLDPAIAADIEYLKKFQDGDFLVTSRTLDDKQWTVAYMHRQRPGEVLPLRPQARSGRWSSCSTIAMTWAITRS